MVLVTKCHTFNEKLNKLMIDHIGHYNSSIIEHSSLLLVTRVIYMYSS